MAAGNATFFVHAMLGFGSLSLAWDSGSQDAKSLGYRHGAVALQGLQNAINAFSQENADAVLASSVVLSWQANDFHAWQSLISGIRTVSGSTALIQFPLTIVGRQPYGRLRVDFSTARTHRSTSARAAFCKKLRAVHASISRHTLELSECTRSNRARTESPTTTRKRASGTRYD